MLNKLLIYLRNDLLTAESLNLEVVLAPVAYKTATICADLLCTFNAKMIGRSKIAAPVTKGSRDGA